MILDGNKAPFITQKTIDDRPLAYIEEVGTRIELFVSDESEPQIAPIVDAHTIYNSKFIADPLFTICSKAGLKTLTLDGKTIDMEYKKDFKNLERYIRSKEYIRDIIYGSLYKQLLVDTIKAVINECIHDIVQYKRSRVKYNMQLNEKLFFEGRVSQLLDPMVWRGTEPDDIPEDEACEYYRNILINGDELVIFAGKCIRYLEFEYIGEPILTNRYIFGNQGYYDTCSNTYCRLNRG